MSLRIRIKIAVVVFTLAFAAAVIFYSNGPETEFFTKHFFEGLLHGLVFTVVIFWGISSLVNYLQKRKQEKSGQINAVN